MIYIDIDGVCVDFIGTARKFGIELEPNEFGKWRWGADGFPTAEQFYKAAEPQPWLDELVEIVADADYCIGFITKPQYLTGYIGANGLTAQSISEICGNCRTCLVLQELEYTLATPAKIPKAAFCLANLLTTITPEF
jgi:hypothetical protein